MKRVLFVFLIFSTALAVAQHHPQRMTFLIVIDNEFPAFDIIDSKFIIKDKADSVIDLINFSYRIGKLIMPQSEYEKLFHIKIGDKLIVKFKQRNLDLNTDYTYEEIIDSRFVNSEYLVLRIYNTYNTESKAKYYFKKDQTYVCQMIMPGFRTILTTLKKQ